MKRQERRRAWRPDLRNGDSPKQCSDASADPWGRTGTGFSARYVTHSAWAAMLLALASLTAIAVAQQIKRGSVAEIRAEELQYDWETGRSEMTGNPRVDIKGDYDATMTASSLVVETDIEKAQVLSFEARGPVNFDILTRPSDGKRSQIQARCTDSATFSEKTMLVVMKGNAHAEITGVPRVENVKSAVYDGDSMTIDLKNHTIKLSQAHLKVEMAPETAEAAEGTE